MFRNEYNNQQVYYEIAEDIDLESYNQDLDTFSSQQEYNAEIEKWGNIRSKCKKETQRIAETLSNQLNVSPSQIYRFVFKYAVDVLENNQINVRSLLSSTMKRLD